VEKDLYLEQLLRSEQMKNSQEEQENLKQADEKLKAV